MERTLIGLLAIVAALSGPLPQDGPNTATVTYEVNFAPLKRAERDYADMGPAGPFYPAGASDNRKSGEAYLRCVAKTAGILEQCRVISENPSGFAFGEAAQVMANRHRITAAGSPPPGETIRVRVPFDLHARAKIEPRRRGCIRL